MAYSTFLAVIFFMASGVWGLIAIERAIKLDFIAVLAFLYMSIGLLNSGLERWDMRPEVISVPDVPLSK